MPVWNGLFPREGLTIDPIARLIKRTALNPAIVLPLLLFLRFVKPGQDFAQAHETIVNRIRLLLYLGLVRWANRILSRGSLNNWQNDKYEWHKEIVVVTGGSDGIGKAVVELLAKKDITVVVLDIQPLAFKPRSNIHYYKCDITSPKTIATVASAIRADIGYPTVLINNAGAARGKSILDSTEADVRLTFDVNALSHYWLVKEFLPDMIAKNHGMVVTIASMASYVTFPQMVDYAATKAAALSFHEGLGAELKTRYNAPKVRTVIVTSGFVKTPLFASCRNDSTFLSPTLEPETIAEAIVQQVLRGSSGQVVLPAIGNIFTALKSLPHWMQNNIRAGGEKTMVNWNGRQVVDPEAKYEPR